ncbi:MAG: nicotinate (nicotinamide) nucleotide adenylyltransferase [Clostridia bacterium]|jgi:nicotinate-nucleotide adenylyltransferase|nr:nicotinate (nicotinamide) nucleotide adenylyltransferase [Clostridia bacterium]
MKSLNKRIGILGGTFNPIHNAHIAMAQSAIKNANLDKVLLLVANNPPHKNLRESVKASDRMRMAQLAAADYPKISICDIEFRIQGKSYAVKSLDAIRKKYTNAKLFYIVGGDTLESMPYWYESGKIFSYVSIVCIRRCKNNSENGVAQYIEKKYGTSVQIIEDKVPDISSTVIRENIRKGLPIDNFVPASVAHYIYENHLYMIRNSKETVKL